MAFSFPVGFPLKRPQHQKTHPYIYIYMYIYIDIYVNICMYREDWIIYIYILYICHMTLLLSSVVLNINEAAEGFHAVVLVVVLDLATAQWGVLPSHHPKLRLGLGLGFCVFRLFVLLVFSCFVSLLFSFLFFFSFSFSGACGAEKRGGDCFSCFCSAHGGGG